MAIASDWRVTIGFDMLLEMRSPMRLETRAMPRPIKMLNSQPAKRLKLFNYRVHRVSMVKLETPTKGRRHCEAFARAEAISVSSKAAKANLPQGTQGYAE